jgi:HK97 family phage prohead protease
MLHKSFGVLDAKADSETGTFEATVAVFGNVDKGGDRIIPGAFKSTLQRWRESGDPIPVILSHQWDNPMAHIGVVNEAAETEKGLFVTGTLDVKDNDVAKQVHRLMMRRSLKEFSFGYSVPKGGQKRAKDGANELTEIDLAEVGPTLKGMNPATELHAVKSALDAEEPTREELVKELQEVKQRLAEALTDLEKKADEEEPGRRTHSDPLRKQAEALALEIATGGTDLRKPPKQEPEPVPDLVPLGELKRQSRDLMLEILTGQNGRTT